MQSPSKYCLAGCGRQISAESRRSDHLCATCRGGPLNKVPAKPLLASQVRPPQPEEPPVPVPIADQVAEDRHRRQGSLESRDLRAKYEQALRRIDELEREAETERSLISKGIETFKIEPRHGSGTSEATAVVLASDWHVGERVLPGMVNGLNEHNLDIARRRAHRFWQSTLRLIRIYQQDVKIEHAIVALLGDFISNDIHDELAETNEVGPMFEVEAAQSMIASGLEFLLEHTTLKLTVPCHSGNHARTTKTTRFASENAHSLEYLMFRHLEQYFRGETRVQFIVPEGYHSYLDIYGRTIRFHHGHAIRYGGGVGGIYIPANKAIAQWDKARRAHLDVFGHFHQFRDGGKFLSNGSSIGWNPFAISIKADFEPPQQTMFLVDRDRWITFRSPIHVTEKGGLV